jgi:LytS/YehU family sensor histidine kinase
MVFYGQTAILGKYFVPSMPRHLYIILAFFALLSVSTGAKAITEYARDGGLLYNRNFALFKKYVIVDGMRGLYYAGLATLYWTAGNLADFRRKSLEAELGRLQLAIDNAELKTRLANTRNVYLQQQLHPHLLFNTLNFVYNSVYKHSESGGKAVLLLAEMMEYSLKASTENSRVSLADEIMQVENLISINRFRYERPLKINLIVNGDPMPYLISPLILLTLSENIFKHGNFQAYPVVIQINISENGLLQFSTFNRRKEHMLRPETGIGLRNTRLRLDHSYGDKYTLDIRTNEEIYETDLTVQL